MKRLTRWWPPVLLVCGVVACSANYATTSPAEGGADVGADTGGGADTGPGDTGSGGDDAPVDAAPEANADSANDAPVDSADGAKEGGNPEAGPAYDGTTGKMCHSNADCRPAGGPGVAVCSSVAFTRGPLFPTAVCILPTCDPKTDGEVHYCDGPDAPTSPGACTPTTSPPQAGMGVCLPKCTFGSAGQAPQGCQGNDVCHLMGWTVDSNDLVTGVGYCMGGCVTDGDCPSSTHCQQDEGLCVNALTARTKTLGESCTAADGASGACDCVVDPATGMGYCSQFCIVAGNATCPGGYSCDALEPTMVTDPAEASVVGFTLQNSNIGGSCLAGCPGGKIADGGACPSSTCDSSHAAGPTCVP